MGYVLALTEYRMCLWGLFWQRLGAAAFNFMKSYNLGTDLFSSFVLGLHVNTDWYTPI